MRSSIFSSSGRRLALLFFIALTVLASAEWYFRSSPQYGPITYFFFRHASQTDPTNAVFGDSHVLTKQRIPGFSFYGWAGVQPEELLALVEYLYADVKPGRIILEADPQWVGEYHKGREKILIPANFINRRFPLMLTSAYYRGSLLNNLLADADAIAGAIFAGKAAAAPAQGRTAEDRWAELFPKPGFNWTWLTPEDRDGLTKQRVTAQNPREDFETSKSAKDFEQAIEDLVRKGANICLFRTPVTETYLEMTQTIENSRFSAYDKYIKKIAGRWNLKYVDFHAVPLQFDDSAFVNQDHMTDDGYDRLWPLVEKACF